jgi:hypothetical protein
VTVQVLSCSAKGERAGKVLSVANDMASAGKEAGTSFKDVSYAGCRQ